MRPNNQNNHNNNSSNNNLGSCTNWSIHNSHHSGIQISKNYLNDTREHINRHIHGKNSKTSTNKDQKYINQPNPIITDHKMSSYNANIGRNEDLPKYKSTYIL